MIDPSRDLLANIDKRIKSSICRKVPIDPTWIEVRVHLRACVLHDGPAPEPKQLAREVKVSG